MHHRVDHEYSGHATLPCSDADYCASERCWKPRQRMATPMSTVAAYATDRARMQALRALQ